MVAVATFSALAVLAPISVSAAGCGVKFIDSNMDSPGDDNYSLNQEWVKIKNTCATGSTSIAGWTIRDLAGHIYRFKAGVSIGAGRSITLHTGSGADTAAHKYWRSGSAIWNNDGDKATLKTGAGVTKSTLVGP